NRLLDEEFEARMELQRELDVLASTTADPNASEQQIQARLAAYRSATNHLYRADLIEGLQLSDELRRLIAQDLPTPARIRMGRRILEEAYAGLIEISPGGVYPDLEIHTPTPEESTRCYNEYM